MNAEITIIKNKLSRAEVNLSFIQNNRPLDYTEEEYNDTVMALKDAIETYTLELKLLQKKLKKQTYGK
jgi:hypothetical protein